MPNATATSPPVIARESAYATNWEYLADELRRLGLLLQRQVLQQRNRQPAGPLDPLKGLVLSDEEITALVAEIGGPPAEDAPPRSRRLGEPGPPGSLAPGRGPDPGAARRQPP